MSRRRRVQPNVSDRSEQPRARHRRSSSIAPILSAIGVITALTSAATVATVAVVASVGGAPAAAVPGTPGVPQPPTVVYTEKFANNVPAANTPIPLTSYVGAGGETYTADPAWLTLCNGTIVEAASPDSGRAASTSASAGSYNGVRAISYALGLFEGAASPTTVPAVAALTDSPGPGANKVQFQTVNPIPLVATNRFLTFSVDVAGERLQPHHRAADARVLPAERRDEDPDLHDADQSVHQPTRS